jgi:TetR/AcrR family transcriptional repressor of nem operon
VPSAGLMGRGVGTEYPSGFKPCPDMTAVDARMNTTPATLDSVRLFPLVASIIRYLLRILITDETVRSQITSKTLEAIQSQRTERSQVSENRRIMTKGEQTRRRIVEAAAPIFNTRGYEGASLSELMAATGLKKGGIYRHFASKEELAAEAFDYTWDAAWKVRLLHLDEKANGIEKLKQYIANFVDRRGPVAGGCPVLNTAIEADDGNPVLRAHAAKALRFWLSRLQAIVEQARKRGETRPEVDPKAVATVIVASLEGALMMSRLQRNDEPLRAVQSHLSRYLESEVALA